MKIDVDYDWGYDLGKGGFACVRSARKRLNGDLVAIKVIDKSKMRERGVLDRIFSEVKVHKMLNHENIVKYIEHVDDRPGHDTRYAINADKALNELGWKPLHKFSDAINETVNWYMNNNEWSQNIMQTDQYKNWMGKQYEHITIRV